MSDYCKHILFALYLLVVAVLLVIAADTFYTRVKPHKLTRLKPYHWRLDSLEAHDYGQLRIVRMTYSRALWLERENDSGLRDMIVYNKGRM